MPGNRAAGSIPAVVNVFFGTKPSDLVQATYITGVEHAVDSCIFGLLLILVHVAPGCTHDLLLRPAFDLTFLGTVLDVMASRASMRWIEYRADSTVRVAGC